MSTATALVLDNTVHMRTLREELRAANKRVRTSERATRDAIVARARLLDALHRDGHTWEELGRLMGVSRQRAQQMSQQG